MIFSFFKDMGSDLDRSRRLILNTEYRTDLLRLIFWLVAGCLIAWIGGVFGFDKPSAIPIILNIEAAISAALSGLFWLTSASNASLPSEKALASGTAAIAASVAAFLSVFSGVLSALLA